MARTATKKRSEPSRPQKRDQGKGSRRRELNRRRSLPWYRRIDLAPILVGAAALALIGYAGLSRGGGPEQTSPSIPVVGGDLHSLVVNPNAPSTLYAGGHQAVSASHDGGKTWSKVDSLDNADAMGWAFTDDAIFVGGHPGISVSRDGGKIFEMANEGLPATDIHALGAGDGVIYAGSPAVGVLASTDEGNTWEVRSDQAGHAFMGRIVVDPQDPEYLLAPDMEAGAVESRDGGRTWRALGVQGAMWVTWDGNDTSHIIVTGAGAAAETTDGGQTWESLEIPEAASIVEMSPEDAQILFAAVHDDPNARIWISRNGGDTWEQM